MNKFQNSCKPLAWLMGCLLTVLIAGCGGDGGGAGGTQPGVLGISLTDAPACGFDEVNVTVSKVRVHQSDNAPDNAGGWTDITLNPPRKINLLDLNDPTKPNFALESLGETPLAAGHYTQLRLVLVPNSQNSLNNSVVLSDNSGNEIALDTPSAIQSGIKLIHQFTVNSGQRVDLLLDFDACKSIVQTGNGTYKLKPVIKVIPFELNGIQGFVDTALLNNNNVMVSAQVDGEIVRATVPNTTTNPGKFLLAHLSAGADVKYDIVITADGYATAVITAVPVPTSTSITTVSTNVAPIGLNPSATGSIGGRVTLSNPAIDDATVFVSARQTFSSGSTVTVKSQTASVVTGDPTGDYAYDLTLPVAAPSLWQYSPSQPIALAADPAVADKYTVQASATGYVTQSFPNIPTRATQNFTLALAP